MSKENVDRELEISQGEDDKDEVSILIDRVSSLEDSVSRLSEQQTEITHKINKHENSINDLSDTLEDIRSDVGDLNSDSEIQQSKIKNINRSLDHLEKSVEGIKKDLRSDKSELMSRISAIEEMIDIDSTDIAKSISPDACELERLTNVPEQSRTEELTVRVKRAVAVYENFHDISTPVRGGGERILSKDIKTFLNGYADTNIKYTQVQRVIDSFEEKTDDSFSVRKTSEGRAIIWTPE